MDFNGLWNTIKTDKNWFKKIGIIWGLSLITYLISVIVQVLTYSSGLITPFISEEYMMLTQLLLMFILPFSIQILIFPIYLYISGYKFKIAKDQAIDDHSDIKSMFKLGGIYITTSLSMNIVFGLLSILVSTIFLILLIAALQSFNLAMILGVISGAIVMMFISFFVMTFINGFLVPSMMFIYLKTESIPSMFNIDYLKPTLKAIWQDLLLLMIVNYFLGILLGMFSFILCCLGPLTSAAVETIRLVLNGLLLGQIYSKHRIEI